MVHTRYYTFWNFFALFALSFGLYYAFMWICTVWSWSKTYGTIGEMHEAPLYYLTVLLNVGLCFCVALFQRSFNYNFRTSPSDFLREVVIRGFKLEDHKREFERIYARIKSKYVDEDMDRERELDRRREEKTRLLEKARSATKVKPEQMEDAGKHLQT